MKQSLMKDSIALTIKPIMGINKRNTPYTNAATFSLQEMSVSSSLDNSHAKKCFTKDRLLDDDATQTPKDQQEALKFKNQSNVESFKLTVADLESDFSSDNLR